MENYKTHKDLDVWKLGIDLVEKVYDLTKGFPAFEQYGLTAQLRRASVSLPANIAEGAARQTVKEYIQFLYIALGSLSEMETLFIVSRRLGYLGVDLATDEVIVMIRKKLLRLIQYLKTKKA